MKHTINKGQQKFDSWFDQRKPTLLTISMELIGATVSIVGGFKLAELIPEFQNIIIPAAIAISTVLAGLFGLDSEKRLK